MKLKEKFTLARISMYWINWHVRIFLMKIVHCPIQHHYMGDASDMPPHMADSVNNFSHWKYANKERQLDFH